MPSRPATMPSSCLVTMPAVPPASAVVSLSGGDVGSGEGSSVSTSGLGSSVFSVGSPVGSGPPDSSVPSVPSVSPVTIEAAVGTESTLLLSCFGNVPVLASLLKKTGWYGYSSLAAIAAELTFGATAALAVNLTILKIRGTKRNRRDFILKILMKKTMHKFGALRSNRQRISVYDKSALQFYRVHLKFVIRH